MLAAAVVVASHTPLVVALCIGRLEGLGHCQWMEYVEVGSGGERSAHLHENHIAVVRELRLVPERSQVDPEDIVGCYNSLVSLAGFRTVALLA